MCWVLPMPLDAYLNPPGLAAMAASRSLMFLCGELLETTSTLGITATRPMACRSFSGSYLSLSRCGATACPVLVASSRVVPSAVARAVNSAAMVLEAPGRFSTTTDCLRLGANLSLSIRARMSVPPPGDAPTMMRIALSGQAACAPAVCGAPSVMVTSASGKVIRISLVFSIVVSVWPEGKVLLHSNPIEFDQ